MPDVTVVRSQHPFARLRSHQILGMGDMGRVYVISDKVAFKGPRIDGTCDKYYTTQAAANEKSLEREKGIYGLLRRAPHPNVIHHILDVQERIFLERCETTLGHLILKQTEIELTLQCRWTLEIAKAIAWLETLSIVHGDLRPPNVLLDRQQHVRLSDFDNITPIGERMEVATEPFYQMDPNDKYNAPIAGAESEQFALASVVYTMRFGCEPLAELGSRELRQKMRTLW